MKPDLCKAKTEAHDVVAHNGRQRRQQLSSVTNVKVEHSATVQPNRVSAVRLRSSIRNPYESVLPLIHKMTQNHSSQGFKSFSGYVPKAHRDELNKSPQLSASGNAELAVKHHKLDDLRQPRVCFSVPLKDNAACDAGPKLPDDDTHLSQSRNHKVAIQNADDSAAATNIEMPEVPTSSVDSPSIDADFMDDLSKLCDEIIACDTFPEQLPASNLTSDSVTDSDTSFKDDLQMPVAIDEFTFDDMMTYLFD